MIYLIIISILLYIGICFEVAAKVSKDYSGGKFAIWLIAFIWPILFFIFLGSLIASFIIDIGIRLKKNED